MIITTLLQNIRRRPHNCSKKNSFYLWKKWLKELTIFKDRSLLNYLLFIDSMFEYVRAQVRMTNFWIRWQFHQHYSYEFFVWTSFSLVMFWLCQKNSHEKFAHLMLMKLTAGVNSINVFARVFHKKCLAQLSSSYFLATKSTFSQTTMLMKLTLVEGW